MIKVHYALADVPSKIFTIEIQSKTTCGEFLLLLCEKEKKVYHILFFEGSQVDMQDQIIDYISNQYCVFIASLTDDIPSKEFISSINVLFQDFLSKSEPATCLPSIKQLKVSNSSFKKNLGISPLIEKSTKRLCFTKLHQKHSYEGTICECDEDILLEASIKHPAAVPFLGYNYNRNGDLQLYYEYPEKGSLGQFLGSINNENKDPLFDDTHKLIISYGLACYIEYLHKKNLKHKFFRISDIFLDSQLYPHVIFLTEGRISNSRKQIIGQEIHYMPLLFLNVNKRNDSDVYLYGTVLSYLIHGLFNSFVDQSESIPPLWEHLIIECLNDNITSTQICNLLESESFVNDSIDKDEFEAYKKIVMPYRL